MHSMELVEDVALVGAVALLTFGFLRWHSNQGQGGDDATDTGDASSSLNGLEFSGEYTPGWWDGLKQGAGSYGR